MVQKISKNTFSRIFFVTCTMKKQATKLWNFMLCDQYLDVCHWQFDREFDSKFTRRFRLTLCKLQPSVCVR